LNLAAQNRGLWRTLTALLFLALLAPVAQAKTVAQKKQIARTQFENAERMREALNGRPASDRTRKDYNQVIDAYRRVYYVAPSSSKADAAVMAVAELLADEARTFNDLKLLQAAIGQYNFLRKEYPGSKYRMDALFTIGQIQRDDLGDDEAAKQTFQEFLDKYPHHSLADEAKKAIAQIDADAAAAAKKKDKNAKATNPFASKDKGDKTEKSKDTSDASNKDVTPVPVQLKTGPFPLVTGIRHWSTPDYTRIAIDLGSEIKYEAGRVPNPDRIFFDLHGTKLAPELVGKTFDVDDGFLRKIRVAQYQRGETRVVLEVNDVADYSAFLLPNPYRLIIDIHGKPPSKVAEVKPAPKPVEPPKKDTPRADAKVEPKPAPKIETKTDKTVAAVKPPEPPKPAKKTDDSDRVTTTPSAKDNSDKDTLITAAEKPKKDTPSPTTGPTYESVSPRNAKNAKKKTSDTTGNETASLGQEAKPTSDGDRSLIRALGLKIGKIVVDAGHGGHDTGTIGPKGLEEKDLVLDVALRLGKLLEQRLGADVVYTRDDDTFIPLETRTAIANKEEADLFISVHANSSRDQSARGVEVYYLNFTSAPDALEVAARENAVSDKSIHELQDLVKKIALKEKIEESREFASDVDSELYRGLRNSGLKNRGVKKAPFIVLIGANMPSILAEISFVSNPSDEKKLKTPDYRQKIAESLYRGVARYANGLSGVKVATKSGNGAGQ
jgi:N-acetylmuramoyl-L-alanine amidase